MKKINETFNCTILVLQLEPKLVGSTGELLTFNCTILVLQQYRIDGGGHYRSVLSIALY